MAQLDSHVIGHIEELLGDQHELRHMAGISDGALLQTLFMQAALYKKALEHDAESALQKLVQQISFAPDRMILELDPSQLGVEEPSSPTWKFEITRPKKKPFREAKLRIGNATDLPGKIDDKLVGLMADAMATRKLVLASPDVPLHKIAKREGRCRKQLTQLVKLSWLSPRIVELIVEGRQPTMLNRKRLMEVDLPSSWSDQERILGFSC